MNRQVSLGVILVWLTGLAGSATAGVQLWTEAGLSYKISKKFRLKFDSHLRFTENLAATESLMPEIAFSYRPMKFLSLEAGYRFGLEPVESLEGTYFDSWHRLFADVRLRYRLKPVTLRYRLRLQEKFAESRNKHTVRNKVEAILKLSAGFHPFVSGEIFNRIGDAERAWHKWRLSLGLDYALGAHVFTLFYRLENYLHDEAAAGARHILAVGYHYGF